MRKRSVKVIFDTNVWLSFLIGKRLAKVKKYIASGKILLVASPYLLQEIIEVTKREKIKKYFPEDAVKELIALIENIGFIISPSEANQFDVDPKDSFLLDLAMESKADFLVTGDKALLKLRTFLQTKIVSPTEFERLLIQ